MPDNDFIAEQFSLMAKLMDIHGENSFKIKSYSNAAYTIDKLSAQLSSLPHKEIFAIKGIGDAIGKKIIDILETGELRQLSELISNTPPGILEMLTIKGIGAKKIATIWKEMEIESIGELLYACNENRLTLYKGFGEKTQNNVRDSIEFYLKSRGSYLYSEAEALLLAIDKQLKNDFSNEMFEPTGAFREQMETIDRLEWVTTGQEAQLVSFFNKHEGVLLPESSSSKLIFKTPEGLPLVFHLVNKENFFRILSETTCPAFHPGVIQVTDIKGIIHTHSDWSDGSHSIEEMARECIKQGFEYLVVSDHSKSAQYAKGLYEERVMAQHQQIAALNAALAPFRIFKSIESDILNDGALDYSDEVLASFDLVIASVHSNLKMSEEKAMVRLLKAIENPFTTILGHMTGRLLLSRSGYPVDHKKIIDACVANKVVIELNAHPRRLDIDWRYIPYAMEKGALLSINPDAHSTKGYLDIKYGVLAAQKGGLTKDNNLSSFSLKELEDYLAQRRNVRNN
ncbi:MAG: DNA polymerase/3'-5' exonuclease PolX [Chitinophagaceae bacterium]|nr:DNA polymerase/3'-5' exonuclease PolX [Chitinophagaceae bacterium]